MPIGSCYKYVTKNRIVYFITSVLGTLDLHTHIRLKPVLKFLKNHMKESMSYKLMEVGCGSGVNAFEIAKISKADSFDYIGFDLNKGGIDVANKIAKKLNIDNRVKFVCADATKYNFKYEDHSFDIILFIDFLEHVRNPNNILKSLRQKLKNDGVFLVSVPTHRYQRDFGKAFHEKVGHIIDGFTLQDLKNLFKQIEAEIVYHEYNTGLISNYGCALYYRILSKNKYVNLFKVLLLYPFKFLDLHNDDKFSCTLFAVFKFKNKQTNK